MFSHVVALLGASVNHSKLRNSDVLTSYTKILHKEVKMSRSFVLFSKVKNQLCRSFTLRNLTLGMIVIGVILRLLQYSLNRSLWLDESFIALIVTKNSFLGLLGPLDYSQVAPTGFLFIEKALVLLLGNNEYVLRLFPLVAGIVSLFLFYQVARRCIREEGALIAVGLFSLSGHLIYYSSEVKQYSSDVTVALLLLMVTIYIISKNYTNLSIVFFAAIGGIAVWFSLPSVFVMAGAGCTLSFFSIARKKWKTNNKLLITYFIWFSSFVVFYLIYSSNISSNLKGQQSLWSSTFMPFPPMSISDFKWFGSTFFEIFSSPLSIYLPGLGALVFLLGCVSMYSKDKQLFFILLSPIFVALFASAFRIYPFAGRTITFLVPFMLLFIGEGAAFLCENTRNHYRRIIWIILIGLLFFGPLTGAVTHAISKTGFDMRPYEDIKSVMKYVKEHKKQDDVLYLYDPAVCPFMYYSERYGFSNDDYIHGSDVVRKQNKWNKYLDDIQKLKGNKRVWLMFSHTYPGDETFFLFHLDRLGTRLDSLKSIGAAVYLYDLSKKHEISE